MKKLFLVIAIVTMAYSAKAQQRLSFGIRAGLNIPSIIEKSDDGSSLQREYNKSSIGFHVGAVLDWRLWKSLYIQPGLYYTTKGAKAKQSDNIATISKNLNLNYLQIPILVSYHFHLSENTKLHISAGPYVAFGIGGKEKVEYNYYKASDNYYDGTDYREVEHSAFSGDGNGRNDLNLSTLDAGFAFGVGVSFHKIYAGLNYDLGLPNIAPTVEKGSSCAYGSINKMKTQSFNISVGYNL